MKLDMWQSRIEIKYSIVYFERITEFDVLIASGVAKVGPGRP